MHDEGIILPAWILTVGNWQFIIDLMHWGVGVHLFKYRWGNYSCGGSVHVLCFRLLYDAQEHPF